MHVYGPARSAIDFLHLSHLYSAGVLPASLEHDNSGDPPGQKFNGKWDVRPHKSRVVQVTEDVLSEWRRLTDDINQPPAETPLLGPISTYEQGAIDALIAFSHRLCSHGRPESFGYREKDAKDRGLIKFEVGLPPALGDAILQGTHFGIATPFAKMPNDPFSNSKDWVPINLDTLPDTAVPRTTYVRTGSEEQTRAAEDVWFGRRYTEILPPRMASDDRSQEHRAISICINYPSRAGAYSHRTLYCTRNRSRNRTERRILGPSASRLPDPDHRAITPASYCGKRDALTGGRSPARVILTLANVAIELSYVSIRATMEHAFPSHLH